MNDLNYRFTNDEVDALERYELFEGPKYRFELNRREFVQALSTGLVISLTAAGELQAQRRRRNRTAGVTERLHVGEDGTITVFTGKVEVGQGARTQFLQAAAEELKVPMDALRLTMADFPTVPDDGGTYGSRTTPANIPDVRRACAVARRMLLQQAASHFNSEPDRLKLDNGAVTDPSSGKRFTYADLARTADLAELERSIGPDAQLTPVDQWRVLGTPVAPVNDRDIVTGAHRYPSDIRRPDMLYGKVLRPPRYGAELQEIDLAPAHDMPDVVAVHDGNFVGFAAPTSFQAERARREVAKTARWTEPKHVSSDRLYTHLRETASEGRSRGDSAGSVEEGFDKADKILRETYHVAYVQHSPMETRAAVAEWNEDQLTVWTGGQVPTRVLGELARSFRIPAERVRVVIPDTGGAFGGKHTGETAVEAARLARAAKRPVCLQWDREEEFAWAYFRPAGVMEMAAGLDADKRLLAWTHTNINSGGSAIESPYDLPHARTESKSAQSPLREGSYRALAATANNFARESFMDELAASAGIDPLSFRLRHLNEGRLRDVLLAAAERFGWEKERQKKNRPFGIGLACGTEKGSYVACCAAVEADQDKKTFRVTRVCEAFECGAIQNPKNLQAQVEGCLLQGLGPALREEIRFENGMVTNPRFSEYEVPRISDLPEVRTVLVDRPDLPSVGAGETPIIAIAPAVANALFDATGHRIRSMPLRDSQWQAAT